MSHAVWNIRNIERNGTTDEVQRIHARVVHQEEGYYTKHNLVVNIPAGTFANTAYADLTADQCVSAIKTILGDEEVLRIEGHLEDKILELKNPPIKSGLPWVQEETPVEEPVPTEPPVEP